jgi:phospholipase D1/2
VKPAPRKRLLWTLAAACAVVAAVALVWRFTPLSEVTRPERLAQWLETFSHVRWAPVVVVAVYVVGGLIMLPVMGLSVATAMVFKPAVAIAASFVGTMLSAALLYALGARFFRGRTTHLLGARMERVEKAFSRQGVVAVASVRMVPLAPFTVVNLAAGAIGVRFRDYMLGTALGLAPGITVLSLFGNRVRAQVHHPSTSGVLLIIGIALAWLAISFTVQRLVAARQTAVRAGG